LGEDIFDVEGAAANRSCDHFDEYEVEEEE
jgi:hypothetical protein